MLGTLKWLGRLAVLSAIGAALVSPLHAEERSQELLRVRFTRPTFFQGVLLRGDYLFLHEEDKMANEEPCLFVYRERTGTADTPIASLHGTVVEGARTAHARVEALRISEGTLWYLREIQFPGSTAAHRPQ